MRVRLAARELATITRVAAGVAGDSMANTKRKAAAVLDVALLTADAGRVRATGTNLILWISGETSAAVDEPGTVALPGKALAGLIAGMPADQMVTISVAETTVLVTTERSRYLLPRLIQDAFPETPHCTANTDLVVSAAELRKLFDATTFAICDDDTSLPLSGVLLHLDAAGRLAAVGCDKCALALRVARDIMVEPQALPPAGIIISKPTAAAIGRLKGALRLRADSHLVEVAGDGVRIVSKLIDAQFPPCDRLISANANANAELERSELLGALVRISAANAAAAKPTSVQLSWNGGPVMLELANELAADEIPATTSGNAAIKLGVDRFINVINAVAAERLVLGFTSPTQPIRIQSAGAGDILAVLAPRVF